VPDPIYCFGPDTVDLVCVCGSAANFEAILLFFHRNDVIGCTTLFMKFLFPTNFFWAQLGKQEGLLMLHESGVLSSYVRDGQY